MQKQFSSVCAAEVVQAVLSGDVQFMMDAAAVAQARQDTVTALAVPGGEQLSEFPDVPALASLGYDSISGTGWQMIMGPAGMPDEAVSMVETALKDASTDFCPHCGIGLFDRCGCCSSRKNAFARFCFSCGTAANTSMAD